MAADQNRLTDYIAPLREAGIRVSMFIGHDARQIEASARIGAAVVELHTGHYSDLHAEGRLDEAEAELSALRKGATLAHSLGLEVHAGHGLTYENVGPIAAIPELMELNIGHFLVARRSSAALARRSRKCAAGWTRRAASPAAKPASRWPGPGRPGGFPLSASRQRRGRRPSAAGCER